MTHLTDERVEPWEDPADRKRRKPVPSDTVERDAQPAMRHAKQDNSRKSREKAWHLVERISKPGNHYLTPADFIALARLLFHEQPAKFGNAKRTGVMVFGKTVVSRQTLAPAEAA